MRLLLFALALLVAAPALGQTTISGRVSASAYGNSNDGAWSVTYMAAPNDTFALSGSCTASGDSVAPTSHWQVERGCDSCSIEPGSGTSATLSGLNALDVGTFVTVELHCAAGYDQPGVGSSSATVRAVLRTE